MRKLSHVLDDIIARIKSGPIATGQFQDLVAGRRKDVSGPLTPQVQKKWLYGLSDKERFDAHRQLQVASKHGFTTDFYLRLQDRADWQGSEPELRDFLSAFILACRRRGVPMYAHTVFRNKKTQNALSAGRSQKKWPDSQHNVGRAGDVVHAHRHWDLSEHEWLYLGALGKEVARKRGIAVRWGGDWNRNGVSVLSDPKERFWDPAHWEIVVDRPRVVIDEAQPVRHTPHSLRHQFPS